MPIDEFKQLKQRSVFSKLKKLFSNDVIVRNIGGKKLKIIDTNNVEYAKDNDLLKDRFNRIRTSTPNNLGKDFALSYRTSRLELFRDFDCMDQDPVISSVLDIYSDECLTSNEMGEILTIRSKNDVIQQTLHNLFYDILNIEFNMWSWTRNLVKYGDFYLRLDINPEYGINMIEPVSTYNVSRIENSDPKNKSYVKFEVNGDVVENWEIVHFRLLSDSNFLPYGKSILEGARRSWKQVSLMEDAMMIHRIMRAPEKRIFKIDIGNIPPNEVDQYMEKLINKTKKVPYMDEQTGDYNLRFNIQNMLEDFYLPVRGSDSGTDITPLGGMEFTGIEDIEYLKNKMMAALKVPKAFLGFDESIGKATLSQEDVRFARTISRIQKILVSELNKIAIIHLYCQGYRDAELVDFSLELTNPSTILEKEKISVWQEKIALAKDMLENRLFSKKWIYDNVFKLSSDSIDIIENDVIEDSKDAYRVKQIEEEGIDPAKKFNKISVGGPDAQNNLGSDEIAGSEPSSELPSSNDGGGSEPSSQKSDKSSEDQPIAEKYRDQTGRKDANDYPFGEDPLGNLENNRKPNKTTKRNPFSEYNLNILSSKKEIISETRKSYLDESNIIE